MFYQWDYVIWFTLFKDHWGCSVKTLFYRKRVNVGGRRYYGGSTLAWKIPRTEEPDGLQSTGSLQVRHDWATSLSLFTFMHWRRKWQPTPEFLPGESQGRGAWWAAVYGVAQSRTRLKWLSSSSSSMEAVVCAYTPKPSLKWNNKHF